MVPSDDCRDQPGDERVSINDTVSHEEADHF